MRKAGVLTSTGCSRDRSELRILVLYCSQTFEVSLAQGCLQLTSSVGHFSSCSHGPTIISISFSFYCNIIFSLSFTCSFFVCCHFLTSQRSFCSLEVVRVTLLFNLRRCAISQKVMTLVTSSDRLLLEVCQVLSVSPQTLYPDVGLSLTSACMWGD